MALAKRQEERKLKAAERLANSGEYTADVLYGANGEVVEEGGAEKGSNNGNA